MIWPTIEDEVATALLNYRIFNLPLASCMALPEPPVSDSDFSAGTNTVVAMMRNSFQLDITNRDHVAWQFVEFGREIVSRVPVFQLSYPRRYDRLNDVCDAVLSLQVK